MKGRTVLIIAHRLSTVRNADQVCYTFDTSRVNVKISVDTDRRVGNLLPRYFICLVQVDSDVEYSPHSVRAVGKV